MNYVTVDVFRSVCFIKIQSIKHIIQTRWPAAVKLFKTTNQSIANDITGALVQYNTLYVLL